MLPTSIHNPQTKNKQVVKSCQGPAVIEVKWGKPRGEGGALCEALRRRKEGSDEEGWDELRPV